MRTRLGVMHIRLILAVALAAAAAPAVAQDAGGMRVWRSIATNDDRRRLHDWRDAFVEALAEARAGGFGAEIARESTLLRPDAALARPAIPNGRYRCRTLKLGNRGGAGLAFVGYRAFDCSVDTGRFGQVFTKTGGSQRPSGRLFPGDDRKLIFLGTMLLGDETRAMRYGIDPGRDMAGAVERIGPRKWRLILPYPRFESTLDVVELIPAS